MKYHNIALTASSILHPPDYINYEVTKSVQYPSVILLLTQLVALITLPAHHILIDV